MPTSTDRWETSRVGEAGELLIAAKLVELGFDVYWAANQSSHDFDLVSHFQGKLNRIQVKTRSIPRKLRIGQDVKIDGGKNFKNYDFLICHLMHHNATYVLPAEAAKLKNISFYPDGLTETAVSNYEQYRDAWHLLR
jgi:hypothetical protein